MFKKFEIEYFEKSTNIIKLNKEMECAQLTNNLVSVKLL